MKIISEILAKIFAENPSIDEDEIERIEELAKQERRLEGAFPPDDVR